LRPLPFYETFLSMNPSLFRHVLTPFQIELGFQAKLLDLGKER
jgi:hypothetical protein